MSDLPSSLFIYGLLAAVNGVAFLWHFLDAIRANRTSGWPQATGRVLRSRVAVAHDTDGAHLKAEVAYRFAVDGREYESDQVAFSSRGFLTRAGARRVTSRFETNSVVPVFYDPAHPARSVLVTGVPRHAYLILIATFVLSIWFGHSFLTELRATRSDTPASSSEASPTQRRLTPACSGLATLAADARR